MTHEDYRRDPVSQDYRALAGAAVAGLFANATATGGLAGRENWAIRVHEGRRAETEAISAPESGQPAEDRKPVESAARVRVGVELTDEQSGYLRALSRPGRTNGPRTLGTKSVATGMLVAAIELLRTVDLDMHGVGRWRWGGDGGAGAGCAAVRRGD